MNVNSIANSSHVTRPVQAGPKPQATTDVAPEETPDSANTVVIDSQADQGQPGVIRLLQGGHFKGVADVRLRINFQQELAAVEADATKSAAGGAVTALGDSIGAELESLAGLPELADTQVASLAEQAEGFGANVGAAADAFLAGETVEGDALIQALEQAFETLMSSLEGALAPATVEPPPVEPDEGGLSTEVPDALAAIQNAFASAMEAVAAALEETTVLPALSEPNGNGKAFDKFTAEYAALQATEQSGEPLPVETVDTEV